VRRLVLLVAGALILGGAACVYAATDAVRYSASIAPNKAGRGPVNVAYQETVTLSRPGGTQPDNFSEVDFFFPRQILLNGTKFPSPCKQSDIDGKTTIPAKCSSGLIGTGTGTGHAGGPGSRQTTGEDLALKLFNADKGRAVLLVLNGTSPIPIHNRVIPGRVKKLSGGPYGYEIVQTIPASLKVVPNTRISSVVTTSTSRTGKTLHGLGVFQLTSCPAQRKLPAKVVLHFDSGSIVTALTTIACRG
jgi:hypothetical protein